MAKNPITNATIWYGGVDLSGDTNEVTLSADVEALLCTNFASAGWDESTGGLKSAEAALKVFLSDQIEPDNILDSVQDVPLTVTLNRPAAVGDLAWGMDVLRAQYVRRMQVGQLYGGDINFANHNSPLLRGEILEFQDDATASGDGGTGTQFVGGVSATQRLYAFLHVTVLTGTLTSADFKIVSDSANTFAATPEDQITFTQLTSTGEAYEIGTSVAGPITDEYYRAEWTFVGSGLNCDFAVFMAIQ